MSLPPETARGKAAWWAVFAAVCAALLAPLTLTDMPPMLDYPNHMARLSVLAALPDDPVLARFYEPHWRIIPNLALDLIVPPLARIWSIHAVGRVTAGVILLLPLLGAVAYRRALTGRWSYWPLGAALFAYNAGFLRGYLNFIASVGLALLLAAVWVAWRERRPVLTTAVAAVGATLLFFCHLAGLAFFAVLAAAHDIAHIAAVIQGRAAGTPWRAFAARLAAGVLVFALPAFLYMLSDLHGMTDPAEFRSFASKAGAAMFPAKNYVWPLDLAAAIAAAAVFVVCLARRWCVVPLEAGLALSVLAVLFLALPHGLKGTFDVDTRFVTMIALFAPAVLVPAAIRPAIARAIGAACLLLFLARMAVILIAWSNWTGELAAFRAVIAPVQPGDVVLTVRFFDPVDRSPWAPIRTARMVSETSASDAHLPALLLLERRAWWPFLFDNPAQQPIQTKEPFAALADHVDGVADPIALLTRGDPAMRLFTHVLIEGPEPDPAALAAAGLLRLTGNKAGALFVIDWPAEAPPPPPGR